MLALLVCVLDVKIRIKNNKNTRRFPPVHSFLSTVLMETNPTRNVLLFWFLIATQVGVRLRVGDDGSQPVKACARSPVIFNTY